MSDNKKYYYLKLVDSFYDRDEMIMLESMPDGYMYSNILLKLYLRSLKNEGKLLFNERIPYNSTMLSNIVRMPVAVVEKAISIFKELNLIEILDNGAIYMLDIQNFIGESSTEADRKRLYRNKIENEKLLLSGQTVGQMSGQISDKTPPEIDIELELEKDIYTQIIDYLNQKANKSYKPSTKKTIKLIKDRIKEGFTLEDFKKVIDIKVSKWKDNSWINQNTGKLCQGNDYLRPETLFGNKFESYLNESSNSNINADIDYQTQKLLEERKKSMQGL